MSWNTLNMEWLIVITLSNIQCSVVSYTLIKVSIYNFIKMQHVKFCCIKKKLTNKQKLCEDASLVGAPNIENHTLCACFVYRKFLFQTTSLFYKTEYLHNKIWSLKYTLFIYFLLHYLVYQIWNIRVHEKPFYISLNVNSSM